MNQIKSVSLKKCTCFNEKSLEIAPLTVLTGLNCSGKTTILNEIASQHDNVKCYKWLGISFFIDGIESNEGDILLFEHPEAGLHPVMQLNLADSLLDLMSNGRVIVVETHSDHMVNRLCRRYMEDENIRDKIKIYFIDKDNSGNSIVTKVDIDDVDGAICENENFFYQFGSEIERIIDIGYKNKMRNHNISPSNIEKIEIAKEIYEEKIYGR